LALKGIEEYFKQRAEEKYEECTCKDDAEDCTCEERRAEKYMEKFKEYRGDGALHDKYEWVEWVREHAEEVFMDYDYWEWAFSIGETIAIRCLSHLIGIQEAVKRVKVDV